MSHTHTHTHTHNVADGRRLQALHTCTRAYTHTHTRTRTHTHTHTVADGFSHLQALLGFSAMPEITSLGV